MTVLHIGHEAESFTEILGSSATYVGTDPNAWDADYSRASINLTAAVTRTNAAKLVLSSPLAEGWVQFRLTKSGGSGSTGVLMAAYTADDASTLFDINVTGSSTSLYTFQTRGATSDTARTAISPTTSIPSATGSFITVHWQAVSGGMLIELFVDGVLISTATVSNAYLNGKSVGIFRFGGPRSADRIHLSELIVADEDPRGWRVATLVPNAAGATSEWLGSYADVDEAIADDADFISSGTPNQVQLMGMSNLSIAAQNMEVRAVAVSGRARRGTTGPQNLQTGIRTGGVNTFSSNLPGIVPFLAPLATVIWEANPATGLPFTISEVQGIEIGFKSVA